MAEALNNEPIPSSSDNPVVSEMDDCPLPEKRRKLIENAPIEKLELRLGGILCCAVCLDLPQAAVYQCTNGHLMCVACFTHLLADARLRDESATCPNCRVEISKSSASRNLAVEKTVSELPSECKFCSSVFPRHSVQHHEEKICEERQFKFSQIVVGPPAKRGYSVDGLVRIVSSVYRLVTEGLRRTYLVSEVTEATPAPGSRRYRRLTGCKFGVLGCSWLGPAHEGPAHEAACAAPARSAGEALRALADRELRAAQGTAVYKHIVDLLSYEKITFNDLQLKPYRTEEFVHKLYYESSRFSAFGHQWVVKAFVNKHQRDPTQSADRELTYQVILKSKVSGSVTVQWVVVEGPHGAAGSLATAAHAHAFSDDAPEAAPRVLTAHHHHANRLLATKAIHLRLIMFLSCK